MERKEKKEHYKEELVKVDKVEERQEIMSLLGTPPQRVYSEFFRWH